MCKEESHNTLLPFLALGRATDNTGLATYSAPWLGSRERKNLEKAFRKLLSSAPQKLPPGSQLERANDDGRICCARTEGDGTLLSLVFVSSLEYPQELAFKAAEDVLGLAAARVEEEDLVSAEEDGLSQQLVPRFEKLLAKYDSLGRRAMTMSATVAGEKDEGAAHAENQQAHANGEAVADSGLPTLSATLLQAGSLCMHKRKSTEVRYFRLFEDRLEYFKQEADALKGEQPRGILMLVDIAGMSATEEKLVIRLEVNELTLSIVEGSDLEPWARAFESALGLRPAAAPPPAAPEPSCEEACERSSGAEVPDPLTHLGCQPMAEGERQEGDEDDDDEQQEADEATGEEEEEEAYDEAQVAGQQSAEDPQSEEVEDEEEQQLQQQEQHLGIEEDPGAELDEAPPEEEVSEDGSPQQQQMSMPRQRHDDEEEESAEEDDGEEQRQQQEQQQQQKQQQREEEEEHRKLKQLKQLQELEEQQQQLHQQQLERQQQQQQQQQQRIWRQPRASC